MKTQNGPPGSTLVFLENVKVKKHQSLEEIVKREGEKPRKPSESEFSAFIHKDKIEFSAGKNGKKVPIKKILYEHIERILPEERKLRIVLGCMTDKRRYVCSFQFTDYGAYNTLMNHLYEARGWIIESEGTALSSSSFSPTHGETPQSSESDASREYVIHSPGIRASTNTGLKTSFISWELVEEGNDAQVQAGSVGASCTTSSLAGHCECCGWDSRRVYAHENTRPSVECDTPSSWTCSCGRNTRQLPPQARQTQTSRPSSPARMVECDKMSSIRKMGAAERRPTTAQNSLESPTLYVQVPNKQPLPYEDVLPDFDQVKVYHVRPKIYSTPRMTHLDNSPSRTTYRKISPTTAQNSLESPTLYVQVPNKQQLPYEDVLPEFDQVKVYHVKPKIYSTPRLTHLDNSPSRTTYRKISTGAPSSGYSSATILTDNMLELTVTGQNHGEYISDKSVYVKSRPKDEPGKLVYTKDSSIAPPLKRY
ncbi:unnamed protein product [Schistocephalus solidus]|uniref:IRS-type PTB domain-containing protein n=1 Tax=Schistocephalus solidus TaxID=70667 RepID=A0A183SNY8_SCHSO|nr:unnamed protein product [Schistocephalus solidus]